MQTLFSWLLSLVCIMSSFILVLSMERSSEESLHGGPSSEALFPDASSQRASLTQSSPGLYSPRVRCPGDDHSGFTVMPSLSRSISHPFSSLVGKPLQLTRAKSTGSETSESLLRKAAASYQSGEKEKGPEGEQERGRGPLGQPKRFDGRDRLTRSVGSRPLELDPTLRWAPMRSSSYHHFASRTSRDDGVKRRRRASVPTEKVHRGATKAKLNITAVKPPSRRNRQRSRHHRRRPVVDPSDTLTVLDAMSSLTIEPSVPVERRRSQPRSTLAPRPSTAPPVPRSPTRDPGLRTTPSRPLSVVSTELETGTSTHVSKGSSHKSSPFPVMRTGLSRGEPGHVHVLAISVLVPIRNQLILIREIVKTFGKLTAGDKVNIKRVVMNKLTELLGELKSAFNFLLSDESPLEGPLRDLVLSKGNLLDQGPEQVLEMDPLELSGFIAFLNAQIQPVLGSHV